MVSKRRKKTAAPFPNYSIWGGVDTGDKTSTWGWGDRTHLVSTLHALDSLPQARGQDPAGQGQGVRVFPGEPGSCLARAAVELSFVYSVSVVALHHIQ